MYFFMVNDYFVEKYFSLSSKKKKKVFKSLFDIQFPKFPWNTPSSNVSFGF